MPDPLTEEMSMDRRTFLLASAASLVAAPASAAVPLLSEYTVLLGDGTGSATDTASGMGLVGGPYDDPQSGIRLFRKAKVGRSGRVMYRLTRRIDPPVTSGDGVWFNVGLVWGRNPGTLSPTADDTDVATAPLFKGFRITHANKNTVNPDASDKIRLKTYPLRKDVPPREAQVTDFFAQGVPHAMELVWGGGVVTLYDRTMGLKQSFRSSALTLPSTGAWLMWYASPGGSFLVENVTTA
jgi:hypothetical protein